MACAGFSAKVPAERNIFWTASPTALWHSLRQ